MRTLESYYALASSKSLIHKISKTALYPVSRYVVHNMNYVYIDGKELSLFEIKVTFHTIRDY